MNLNGLAIGHRTPFHVHVNKRLIMPNRIGGNFSATGHTTPPLIKPFPHYLTNHHSMLKNKSLIVHETQRCQSKGADRQLTTYVLW